MAKNLTKLQAKSLLYVYTCRHLAVLPPYLNSRDQNRLQRHLKVFEGRGWWQGNALTQEGLKHASAWCEISSVEILAKVEGEYFHNYKYFLSEKLEKFLHFKQEVEEMQNKLLRETVGAHHAMHQLVSLPFCSEYFPEKEWELLNSILIGEVDNTASLRKVENE